ncbi:hypothetical protein EYF80_013063 [Liparis tanakae]|uniref:Uncharacterized protein n=1 Tax=Liparis tanakae TaxID=230148 RepID=A0A4Z2IFQ8_9TELE|nr:hypothetical protein EYF80_013063 [Liparis tanakae]
MAGMAILASFLALRTKTRKLTLLFHLRQFGEVESLQHTGMSLDSVRCPCHSSGMCTITVLLGGGWQRGGGSSGDQLTLEIDKLASKLASHLLRSSRLLSSPQTAGDYCALPYIAVAPLETNFQEIWKSVKMLKSLCGTGANSRHARAIQGRFTAAKERVYFMKSHELGGRGGGGGGEGEGDTQGRAGTEDATLPGDWIAPHWMLRTKSVRCHPNAGAHMCTKHALLPLEVNLMDPSVRHS